MAKEKTSGIYFKVTDEERELIEQRMALMGVRNMSAYIRKMCIDGYIVNLQIKELDECAKLLRYTSNNVNQIARRVNSGGGVYPDEVDEICGKLAEEVLSKGTYRKIGSTKYTNDKQITDHYAIVPTGQGLQSLGSVSDMSRKIYDCIVRRFLSIFYPPAVYQKYSLDLGRMQEHFFASFRILIEKGYLKVADVSQGKKADSLDDGKKGGTKEGDAGETFQKNVDNPEFINMLASLKKGMVLDIHGFVIKEGETSPPKRYTSGSMILAMENAGQLIEDEELRAQIKGSGIGTSATRAEILKKLAGNGYLILNKKTQVITPSFMGEMIYDVVNASIKSLLNPELTASWEKGLTYVAEGSITEEEYMDKLTKFIESRTDGVLKLNNQYILREYFDKSAGYYK